MESWFGGRTEAGIAAKLSGLAVIQNLKCLLKDVKYWQFESHSCLSRVRHLKITHFTEETLRLVASKLHAKCKVRKHFNY
jgi:hypothetical protein